MNHVSKTDINWYHSPDSDVSMAETVEAPNTVANLNVRDETAGVEGVQDENDVPQVT